MANDQDNPAGAAPTASDELLLAATLRDFVPHARAALLGLRGLLEERSVAAPAAAELGPGFGALASQFDAFELLGAARVCRLAARVAMADPATTNGPLAPFGDVLDALEAFVERLARDPLTHFDERELLAELHDDLDEPIDCEIGGEFEADADDFVAAMRDELAHLGRMFATGSLPSSAEIVEARQAASGIAAVAASLDVEPLVELARAIAVGLQRDAMSWNDIDELEPVVDLVRRALDAIGGERPPLAGEMVAAFAALSRFGSAVPAVGIAAFEAVGAVDEPDVGDADAGNSDAGGEDSHAPEARGSGTGDPAADACSPSKPPAAGEPSDLVLVTLDGRPRTLPADVVVEVLDPATAAARELEVVDLRAEVDPADEVRQATATVVLVAGAADPAAREDPMTVLAIMVDGVGEVVAAADGAGELPEPLELPANPPAPGAAD
ncbi:MAG: hypothetical protein NXI31_19750 [bacterium]|nr:hypothetical protein [bacterium]